eukprot:683453-Prorocentrum_lima.AAC.1
MAAAADVVVVPHVDQVKLLPSPTKPNMQVIDMGETEEFIETEITTRLTFAPSGWAVIRRRGHPPVWAKDVITKVLVAKKDGTLHIKEEGKEELTALAQAKQ